MSMCSGLESYLNRQLSDVEEEAFLRHLPSCHSCTDAIRRWKEAREALKTAVARRRPKLDDDAVEALVARAGARSGRPHFHLGIVFAGAAALALVVLVGLFSALKFESAQKDDAPPSAPLATKILLPEDMPVPKQDGGRIPLVADDAPLLAETGDGRLGLSPDTRLFVERADTERIDLRLERGRVAVSLPQRPNQPRMSVRVGRLQVRVTGTVFLVEKTHRGRITVAVTKGAVRVVDPGTGEWRVAGGETFQTDAQKQWQLMKMSSETETQTTSLLTPPPPPPQAAPATAPEKLLEAVEEDEREDPSKPAMRKVSKAPEIPEIEDIKQWILDKEYARADRALQSRLRNHPRDPTALELLAIAERKSGQPEKAVSTYRQIIAHGSALERNRARFRAGIILQDRLYDHAGAISMFRACLAEAGVCRSNAAEVKLRLARSLHQNGELEQYERVLRRIVEEHGGTAAAEKAGLELKRLGRHD